MIQKNKHFLGWIALDIDGTITLDRFTIPVEVVSFLQECVKEGWRIAIVTGRPMAFAAMPLQAFDFPYLLLAQNGTIAVEMPNQKVLFRRDFPVSRLKDIERAYEKSAGDFVIYSGFENRDRIYWRPQRCKPSQVEYIQKIGSLHGEKPIAIHSFSELPVHEIPLVKCFGTYNEMKRVDENLVKIPFFHTTLIRDLNEENFYMLLITDRLATKGSSLMKAVQYFGEAKTVIAAGDDENDASLLEVADIKIAMAHAPESLTSIAHFIAPPTSQMGIIQALQMAIEKNGKTNLAIC